MRRPLLQFLLVMTPLALVFARPAALEAQTLSERFSRLFTFGDCGQPLCLSVDVAGAHGQHYIPSITQGENDMLGFMTSAIASGIANLPFTAATGGVTYEFVGGAPVATSESSGGIFGERSQTLGRGQLLAGVSIHSLSMDEIRGQPISDLTFRFAHQNVGAAPMGDPIFENDIIEVRTNMRINLFVTSAFLSYGVSQNVDIGVLVPLVRTSVSGSSEAQVLPFARPTPHLFGTTSNPSEFADASESGSAVGLGDIALRLKANLFRNDAAGGALSVDVRLPTGSAEDFLGSGEMAVRALGILSGRMGSFSPHLNAGFAMRSGDLQTNSIIGALGFDHLLSEGVTLAADILADFAMGESQLRLPENVVFDEPARRRVRLTDIASQRDHLVDASIGFKLQLPGDYRAVANVLLPMSDGGLRPRQLWTFGFERTY
jgi:hypothetical protein